MAPPPALGTRKRWTRLLGGSTGGRRPQNAAMLARDGVQTPALLAGVAERLYRLTAVTCLSSMSRRFWAALRACLRSRRPCGYDSSRPLRRSTRGRAISVQGEPLRARRPSNSPPDETEQAHCLGCDRARRRLARRSRDYKRSAPHRPGMLYDRASTIATIIASCCSAARADASALASIALKDICCAGFEVLRGSSACASVNYPAL